MSPHRKASWQLSCHDCGLWERKFWRQSSGKGNNLQLTKMLSNQTPIKLWASINLHPFQRYGCDKMWQNMSKYSIIYFFFFHFFSGCNLYSWLKTNPHILYIYLLMTLMTGQWRQRGSGWDLDVTAGVNGECLCRCESCAPMGSCHGLLFYSWPTAGGQVRHRRLRTGAAALLAQQQRVDM